MNCLANFPMAALLAQHVPSTTHLHLRFAAFCSSLALTWKALAGFSRPRMCCEVPKHTKNQLKLTQFRQILVPGLIASAAGPLQNGVVIDGELLSFAPTRLPIRGAEIAPGAGRGHPGRL